MMCFCVLFNLISSGLNKSTITTEKVTLQNSIPFVFQIVFPFALLYATLYVLEMSALLDCSDCCYIYSHLCDVDETPEISLHISFHIYIYGVLFGHFYNIRLYSKKTYVRSI